MSRSGAFVRPVRMEKIISLFAVAALAAGCASSSGSDAAEPAATPTAEATATSDMPEPPPTAAETSTAAAPPAPPPLPESFTKVQGPYQALITKLGTDIGAANGDCKKISAGLSAFVADKNNAKTVADYKAEEAKLTPEQSKPIMEANNTANTGLMAPISKCGQEPAHKAAIGAATTKMMAMMGPAPAAAAAGSAAPAAGSAAPAKTATPAAKK